MLKSLRGLSAGLISNVTAVAAIAELQGLTFSLLGAKGAGVKNDLAAIRSEDVIIAALNNNAGTITDIKATTTIADCRAKGTITCTNVVAGDTVTVAGQVYTAVAGVAANYTQFSVAGDNNADAAALAAVINAREDARNVSLVSASAATNVVTVTAVAEGTAGNAITLAETGAMVISGATLAGGTTTGGIVAEGATNQVLLLWIDKK